MNTSIACPKMGVKIGSNYVAGKFYIDDISLMTGNIENMNIASDILRAESSSTPYHAHWTKLIFSLWNSLQSNNDIMAHES